MTTGHHPRLYGLLFVMSLCLTSFLNRAAGESEIYQYFYDANGNLTRTLDPLLNGTVRRFDALDRPSEIEDALGAQTRLVHDGLDQLIGVTDPVGATTEYGFDGLGNPLRVESTDGGAVSREFDDAGNLIAAIDARGATLRYRYDALNRLTTIEAATTEAIQFSYDQGPNGIGRLTGLLDETGQTTWRYDSLGRSINRTSLRAEATLSLQYEYDGNGRLRQIIYPSGQRIGLSWNNGLVVEIGLNGAPLLTQVHYEPFGPPSAWVWNNGSEYLRKFDLDGRLVQLQLAQRQRNLAYDPASRIFELSDSDPLHSWAFTYDALDQLLSAAGASDEQAFRYDANGNRLAQDGLAYVYPAAGNRLLRRGEFTYEHDAAGNVTSDSRRHFEYDAHSRMTRIEIDGASFEYRYDGFGTRAAKWSGRAPDMTGDVDRDGRFSITDARRLALMAQGAMSPGHNSDCDHDGSVTYLDVPCVLRKVIDQRTHPERYNQTGTLFVHDDAGHLLGEYDRTGQVIREIVWLGDQAVAVLKPDPNNRLSSQIFFIYTDHLNTPRVVVDSARQIVWQWESPPFGEGHAEDDPDQDGQRLEFNLRFPGQYYDTESGLHYNMARYYDPETGRYLQPDPVGVDSQLNSYVYTKNNPLSYTDPYGLWAWGDPLHSGIVNASAGLGDAISTTLTFGTLSAKTLRDHLSISGGVNECAAAYAFGSSAGFLIGSGTLWAAGLNGGANSTFWSGHALGAREIAMSIGTTVERTPIGATMNWLQQSAGINLPNWLWRLVSATFALNAKGTANAVILSAGERSTWSSLESPILAFRQIPVKQVTSK